MESFAVALRGLGVRPGEVVAIQLPNWWQVNALVLACARSGAIVAPIGTPIRNRELELMPARLGAVGASQSTGGTISTIRLRWPRWHPV